MNAWFPVNYALPDNAVYKNILFYGLEWQIIETSKGKALIAKNELIDKWNQLQLVKNEHFDMFSFGTENYGFFLSGENYILEPIGKKLFGSVDYNDAISFAVALKNSREKGKDIPLTNGIFVEKISVVLPIYEMNDELDDDVIIGKWCTLGVNVSIFHTKRIKELTLWSEQEIQKIIDQSGLSRSKYADKENVAVQFDKPNRFHLAGRPELETFFNEHIIDFIQNKERYKMLGVSFPGAIILHGPPGSGKTFAIEKLIEYLEWPSYRIEASSVASPYIHETSKKIAEVFEEAMKNAPSILVIDEMEAFLSERDMGAGKHTVEEVAEFLRRIPEATANEVLIVGMTNKLDMIDPAILRRGRFDHVIMVDYASEEEIRSIMDEAFSKVPVEDDIKMENIISKLKNRPISDIAFFLKESARITALNGKDKIDQESIDLALDRLLGIKTKDESTTRRMGFV